MNIPKGMQMMLGSLGISADFLSQTEKDVDGFMSMIKELDERTKRIEQMLSSLTEVETQTKDAA